VEITCPGAMLAAIAALLREVHRHFASGYAGESSAAT
jgi:hypothetical protein